MSNNKELVSVKEGKKNWEELLETESVIAPLVDIFETSDDYILVANMPGVQKEDIQLKLEEESLVIFGRINVEEISNRRYILNETEQGNYFRKFRIAKSIDESGIEARYENGQLRIKLPKHERVKPKTINIR
jgi:HSP20 family protein